VGLGCVSQRGGVHPSLLLLVWLLLHPRGRRGVLVDRGRGRIYIGGIPVFQGQGLFGCGLATIDFFLLTCLCALSL